MSDPFIELGTLGLKVAGDLASIGADLDRERLGDRFRRLEKDYQRYVDGVRDTGRCLDQIPRAMHLCGEAVETAKELFSLTGRRDAAEECHGLLMDTQKLARQAAHLVRELPWPAEDPAAIRAGRLYVLQQRWAGLEDVFAGTFQAWEAWKRDSGAGDGATAEAWDRAVRALAKTLDEADDDLVWAYDVLLRKLHAGK